MIGITFAACLVLTLHTVVASGGVPLEAAAPSEAEPGSVSASGGALPLTDELSGEAKAQYNAARLLYDDGDYAGALFKLERVYELTRDARVLWNMAACEKQRRRYAPALRLAQRYLSEGRSLVSPKDRREAEAFLAGLQESVSPLTVVSNVEGAKVFVDDEEIAVTPMTKPALVDMGRRRIRVSKPGFVDATTVVRVLGLGRAVDATVNLAPERHEGTLVVHAAPGQWITVDGRQVGRGRWKGTLPAGVHRLAVSAPGMKPREQRLTVPDAGRVELWITLEPDQPPREAEPVTVSWLPAAAFGVALAGAAVAVGGYFLLEPERPAIPEAETVPLRSSWFNPQTLVVGGGALVAVGGGVGGYVLYRAEQAPPSQRAARCVLPLVRGGFW